MKINDEGSSNAAHWHERAMKAEARLQKIMARCADLLDEDQFNELDAIVRAAVSASEDIVREQRLAEAEALLRDVRDHGGTTWRNLTARIDAFLAGVSRPASTAPTDST